MNDEAMYYVGFFAMIAGAAVAYAALIERRAREDRDREIDAPRERAREYAGRAS